MHRDRVKWNEKYRRQDYPTEPSGIVKEFFETLLEVPGGAGHGERCRDYFLKPNELLHSFLSLRVLHYHEECDTGQDEHRRLASLVAVRP